MPWDELEPRRWPAFDKELDGISKETMEDHFKLYEGYAKKSNECRKILNEFHYSEIEAAREGALRVSEEEEVPAA